MNLSASDTCNPKSNMPTARTVIIYGVGGTVLVAGTIIAAPLVLPTGTIIIIQTTATTVATKLIIFISNLSIASKVSLGISGAKVARPYIIKTTEEQFNQVLAAENAKLLEAKIDLTSCFMKNKVDIQKNNLDCPKACRDLADIFTILAGKDEIGQMLINIK